MANGAQPLTPDMIAGFQQGAGFPIGSLSLLILVVAATVYLLWGAWTLVGLFRGWVAGRVSTERLAWSIGSVLTFLLIILYYF